MSFELFYICKVLDFGVADQPLEDRFNYVIPVGTKYINGQYLELVKENKKKVFYKLIEKDIFIFPAERMSPMVPMKDNFLMSTSEYQ